MKKTLFLFLSTVCLSRNSLASTICRSNRRLIPHQNSLWFQNFPYETHPNDAVALCEGSITQDEETGEICIDGRVSYRQLADTIGKPIFAPASSTISVTGHLVTGSGNVVLGEKAKFLQDFVTSVTVNNEEHIIENNDTSTRELSTGNVFSKSVSALRNGTTTVAGNLTDLLFTASRGTIDGVCFSSDFAQDKSYYSISQKSWAPGNVDISELQNANLIFGSRLRVVGEFHESAGAPLISANTVLSLFNIILTIPIPAIFYSFIPVLPIAGLLRQAMVFGTVSTKKHPQPLVAPSASVQNIQVDVEWPVLMTAIENGLFKDWPLYGGAVIKRISASDQGCWSVDAAALDIQLPINRGDELDDFVNNVIYPTLTDLGGTVSLHFGKRIPENSDTLQSALNFYEDCGVEVGLDLGTGDCFHPLCNRGNSADSFTYPAAYYEFK